MRLESDQDYHVRRARAELDLAYRSECRTAMEAHLRLSTLHMQKLNGSQSASRGPGLHGFGSPLAGAPSPWRTEGSVREGELEVLWR